MTTMGPLSTRALTLHGRVFDRDVWEERAAIMEYDGGLSREQAEWHAAEAQGFTLAEVREMLRQDDAAHR